MRIGSSICWGAAICTSLMMKCFSIDEALVWLAFGSVITAACLAHLPTWSGFRIWPRSISLVGASGLSLVYAHVHGSSAPGTILTILTFAFLTIAILLSVVADGSTPSICHKEKENSCETESSKPL